MCDNRLCNWDIPPGQQTVFRRKLHKLLTDWLVPLCLAAQWHRITKESLETGGNVSGCTLSRAGEF
jgi:hypothetical protein